MIEFGTAWSTTWLMAAPYSLLLLWCALGAIALARLSKPSATAILMAHARCALDQLRIFRVAR